MKTWILLCLLFAAPTLVYGQTQAIPGQSFLSWDHDGVNTQSFVVKDNGTPNVTLPIASMSRSSGGSYYMPFPALTPGLHHITVVACALPEFGPSCSVDSNVLDVTVVVIPSAVGNVRITNGPPQ